MDRIALDRGMTAMQELMGMVFILVSWDATIGLGVRHLCILELLLASMSRALRCTLLTW